MGFQDYVSEVEAANICSVGAATLRRFAEAGYLNIEQDSDGLQLFSRAELVKLFQLDPSALDANTNIPHGIQFSGLTQKVQIERVPTGSSAKVDQTHAEHFDQHFSTRNDRSEVQSIESVPLQSNQPANTQFDDALEQKQSTELTQPSPITLDNEVKAQETQTINPSFTPPNAALTPLEQTQNSAGVDASRAEILRLQHLVTLYEKLLDYKDNEIKAAREERDYLRKRLEWHELQSERNQLLLLAESQNTRQLIATQMMRRSIIRQALEWAGIVSPANALINTQTINLQAGNIQTSASNDSQNKQEAK